MKSINTNYAAMTALQSLQTTNDALLQTQNRISTGEKVSTAQDNAAYWSIATTMRSDNKALSTVQDALGLGSSTSKVGYTALNQAVDIATQLKTKLVAAKEPGIDRSKVQTEIKALQDQLKSVADSAVFSGQNWLSSDSSATNYNASKSIVSSFTRDSSGAISIGTINVDTSKTLLYDASASGSGILSSARDATGAIASSGTAISEIDISALSDSTADQATLDGYIKGVDAGIGEMTSAASDLGAVQTRIDSQKSFISALSGAIDTGISQLVDADMNEESTRLQALQVKQQLGVQALSIANSSSQSIMSLFR